MTKLTPPRPGQAPHPPLVSLAFGVVCALLGGYTVFLILRGGISHHPWGSVEFADTTTVVLLQGIGGGVAVLFAIAGDFVGVSQWRRRRSNTLAFWLLVASLAGFFGWLLLAITVADPGQ